MKRLFPWWGRWRTPREDIETVREARRRMIRANAVAEVVASNLLEAEKRLHGPD